MSLSSSKVRQAGRVALALLREQGQATLQAVATKAGVSASSAKRALEWLRAEGAPASYDPRSRSWRLADRTFSLPLTEPALDDLQATMTAAGLLDALGQTEASRRAWGLFGELERLYERDGKRRAIRPDALLVAQSTAPVKEPRWVLTLLRSVRTRVVEVEYASPWSGTSVSHVFEPWQVGLFDGVLYVRGFSRTRREPRTFRLAAIVRLVVRDAEKPREPVPDREALWGPTDPRFGVDDREPGIATIRFDGAVARWVATARWCPTQEDRWLEDGEILERRMRYGSYRELARRLVSCSDGIVDVDPPELRAALLRIAGEAVRRLGPATTGQCVEECASR